MGFIYNTKKAVLSWFSDIRIYRGGIILFGDSHYDIKGKHTREVIDAVKAGDILVRRYDHYLGSILIPGYWSHGAIYTGDNNVIHMLGDGITKEDILTFLRCDDVALLRHKDDSVAIKASEIAKKSFIDGYSYDYDFDIKDNKAFYCTEFVDYCYEYIFRDSLSSASDILMPDDLLGNDDIKIVWRKD
jgi:hypothetical protein